MQCQVITDNLYMYFISYKNNINLKKYSTIDSQIRGRNYDDFIFKLTQQQYHTQKHKIYNYNIQLQQFPFNQIVVVFKITIYTKKKQNKSQIFFFALSEKINCYKFFLLQSTINKREIRFQNHQFNPQKDVLF
eukprot:TRINITY_DN39780_c0_g1_i1.p5 TRINITY_DN39780_c0_g1~~TRINITY_DN39780_c0_g1_i1.p5  ORF type:complete len:133 (-),score=0.76 TRINITY_DN39780_c0_g1_i1:602-1000(-)